MRPLLSYSLWVNFVGCCILRERLGSSGRSGRFRGLFLVVCFVGNPHVVAIGCLLCLGDPCWTYVLCVVLLWIGQWTEEHAVSQISSTIDLN